MSKYIDKKKHIFKFVSFNTYTLKSLINGELWFGKPENQNDPFEGEFIIEGFSEELHKTMRMKIMEEMYPGHHINYLEGIYNNDQNDRKFIMDYSEFIKKQIRNSFGICCFSKTHENILLWSHYSDSHKGMCLIFDLERLDDCLINDRTLKKPADYLPEVPKIKVELAENGSPFINGYDQLDFKYENFHYEEEVRYIRYFDTKFPEVRNVEIDKRALFGIIFGESMPDDNKRTIVNLVKSIPSYCDVKFYVSNKNWLSRGIRTEIVTEQHPSFYNLFKNQGAKQNSFFY
jgi:Protein of unknown function (DUF2971)